MQLESGETDMATMQLIGKQLLDGLGCGLLMIDAKARPVEANPAAARLLLERQALRIEAGRIRARDEGTTLELRLRVGMAVRDRRTTVLRLERGEMRRPVIAVIVPLGGVGSDSRGGAAIVLADTECTTAPMTETLSNVLHLSAPDTRILFAAANRKSNRTG